MKLKFSLLLLFTLILTQGFAQKSERVFQVVEEMPRFPGCEDMEGSHMEKKACADKKMLEYIYANLEYPETAKKNKTKGLVVVSFIVEKDGSISNAKLLRDAGDGCGEEAIRLVENMPNWRPGIQRNHKVRVQFNLPVRFRLPKD